jgi:hypothetical protein
MIATRSKGHTPPDLLGARVRYTITGGRVVFAAN